MNQNYGPMPWEELLARIPSMQSSPALADVLGLRKKAEEREQPPMMSQGYGSIPSATPAPPAPPPQPMQPTQSMQPASSASPYDDPVSPEVMASAERVSSGWGGADSPDRPEMSRYSDLNRSGFGALGGLLFGRDSLRGGTAYDEEGNFRGMFPMAKGLLSKIFDTEG